MTSGSFIDDLKDIPSFNELRGRQPAVSDDGEGDVAHDNAEAPVKPAETFPCESCGGTGRYRGVRLHQPESKCFACNGRGWFKSSYKDRMQSRAKSAARKANAKELAQNAFNETHPGLIEKLRELSGWNSFATRMLQSFEQWNGLTDKQVEACESMIAKIAVKREAKAEERKQNAGEVDASAIEKMFEVARGNGLSKLAFVAGVLKISPAKETSKNAGALYVKREGVYQGKVMSGRFFPSYDAQADTLAILREIATNPSEAARDYGKRTGRCCCCGRELTDPVSIDAGIGPICASNWGL